MPTASITVGIDFTPCSAVALREAQRLAEFSRASLRAVHVIDTLVAMELEEALSPFQKNIREGLISEARKEWTRFCAQVPSAAGVALDVRIDNRIKGILNSARESKADLLVMGAYGSRRPDVGAGTIATACVRHAHIPVLLVRDTLKGPFKTIVACIDFSDTSLRALDHAARLATQDGAALHILHAFEAPWHQLHYRAPVLEAGPEFQRQYRDALQRRLTTFAAQLDKEIEYLKPTYAIHDFAGHRSGIVEYAALVKADLIVLGTRGRTNLRDILLGTTAEKVLQSSPCSVLAVKPAT